VGVRVGFGGNVGVGVELGTGVLEGCGVFVGGIVVGATVAGREQATAATNEAMRIKQASLFMITPNRHWFGQMNAANDHS